MKTLQQMIGKAAEGCAHAERRPKIPLCLDIVKPCKLAQ
jgi:hypothetical protein